MKKRFFIDNYSALEIEEKLALKFAIKIADLPLKLSNFQSLTFFVLLLIIIPISRGGSTIFSSGANFEKVSQNFVDLFLGPPN